MTNHLAGESSPYLLQHAENPVDWYPWGEEAITRARGERKPIFLSVGYAACHWCHVMERESFEDPETARLLNDHFIAIKVDREQRPDIDSLYMEATQILTGSGGWPMSIFLTPDLRPFYAGTYFPPVRRHNLPGFREVLSGIADAWEQDPGEMDRVAARVLDRIGGGETPHSTGPLTPDTLEQAERQLLENYDWANGGWGTAPKFPQPILIDFLLRRASRSQGSPDPGLEAATHALKAMARGAMYDVVGGGFCRYSTDASWRVPHFEKMLYDNAQLALAYLHAWQLTREPSFKRVVTQTLDFVLREMRGPLGGFFSSLDADSGGREGGFYLWTETELRDALQNDDSFELLRAAYGVTSLGEWEDGNVLQRALDDASLAARFRTDPGTVLRRLDELHRRLLQSRGRRPRPATDDKVLCAWNGLMLRAFAQAARQLDDLERKQAYAACAQRNADFLLHQLRPSGRLRRSWRNGVTGHEVFLEDYGSLILGLLDLYQTDFDVQWYTAALGLAGEMISRYRDPRGGFFDTSDAAALLPLRPKELQDGATPSGNALACEALLVLDSLSGDGRFGQLAREALELTAPMLARYPTAFSHWLNAADFALSGQEQLAILYPPDSDAEALVAAARSVFRPDLVVSAAAFPPPREAPRLLEGRSLLEGKPTAYVCRAFTCQLPVTGTADLLRQL